MTKNGSLYLVYCRPYCFLDAEWIRIILDLIFPQVLAMVETDKQYLTHFRLALQRIPFSLLHFSNSIYKLLVLYKEWHVINFLLWQVLAAMTFFVLWVTTGNHARALEAKAKTITLGWDDWKSNLYLKHILPVSLHLLCDSWGFSIQDIQSQLFHIM